MILTYSKFSEILNNENKFPDVVKGYAIENLSSLMGEKIFSYNYNQEKRNSYFKSLASNNNKVSNSVLISFFDYFMINLKCISELLLYENVREAFKEIVINTIKHNHKDGYLRASFMNAFLGEFELGVIQRK